MTSKQTAYRNKKYSVKESDCKCEVKIDNEPVAVQRDDRGEYLSDCLPYQCFPSADALAKHLIDINSD